MPAVKDFIKKKLQMLAVTSSAILADVIPIIFVMIGLWIVRKASRFFGFEEALPIKIISAFSEVFMVILYIVIVIFSFITIYKLFKEEEL